MLFLGISSYIGNRRGRQSQDGEMISESGHPTLGALLTKVEAHVTDSFHSTVLQQKRRLVHSHLEIVSVASLPLSQVLIRRRTLTPMCCAIYSLHKQSVALQKEDCLISHLRGQFTMMLKQKDQMS